MRYKAQQITMIVLYALIMLLMVKNYWVFALITFIMLILLNDAMRKERGGI